MNKAVFETTLMQIMRQNQEDSPRPRTRSGTLDTHRLPFYKTTDKLFKKRAQQKKGKNYFVSILMDASGSMHGSRRVTPCLNAVQKLSESLQRVQGVHFEIVGFNGIEMKYKDYNEAYDAKRLSKLYYEQCCTNASYREPKDSDMHFMVTYNPTDRDMKVGVPEEIQPYLMNNPRAYLIVDRVLAGENHDGMAVWNSFLRSKERDGRKVLLVFSDGEPTFTWAMERVFKDGGTVSEKVDSVNGDKGLAKAMREASNTGSLANNLLTNVIRLSKRNGIDTIGIGIQSREVQKFYPHWGVVTSTNDIYLETIKQLSKAFRKD